MTAVDWNANPRIRDRDANHQITDISVLLLSFDGDASLFSKLYGVADEIQQNLTQATVIRRDPFGKIRRQLTDDFKPALTSCRSHDVGHIVNQLMQIEVDRIQLQHSLFDLGEIENAIDQTHQAIRRSLSALDISLLLLVQCCG